LSDPADDLLERGRSLLQLLNSCGRSSANCPSTAAAVYNYLNTGRVRGAVCSGPGQAFEVVGDYRRGTIHHIEQLLLRGGHGTHVVVEGDRPDSDRRGPMHSFNMVNVRETVYVADAQTFEVRSDVAAYVRENAFRRRFQFVQRGYRARLMNI
jgi:hypothetical protein